MTPNNVSLPATIYLENDTVKPISFYPIFTGTKGKKILINFAIIKIVKI